MINLWPFKKNSHSQFEALVGPHLNHLYHLAYRFTGGRDDAEDLVQDLLLKLYPRLGELQQLDKPGPWLAKVLYRLFVDQFRRHQRSPVEYVDDDRLYETHSSTVTGPSDNTNLALIHNHLQSALDHLGQEHRILIVLHDVEGYSLEEINAMTDLPVGTIKSRLSRARARLRKSLNYMEPNEASNV